MLIMDLYHLLPAFTLACFLGILLWPENIAYKIRLRLFTAVLSIWVIASLAEMAGYGAAELQLVYIINLVIGFLGLIALIASYHFKPSRDD